MDGVATYECECASGFGGPQCEIDLSNKLSCSGASNPCKHGKCVAHGQQVVCECDHGYTGVSCSERIDLCKQRPCKNGGKCHNLVDDYHCECPPVYENSRNCDERLVDPCIFAPCYNNATCVPITGRSREIKDQVIYTDFKCKCTDHYRGSLCEIHTDPCSSNPCQNRGLCTLSHVQGGTKRTDQSQSLSSFPSNTNHVDYKCKCFPAFTGERCETYFDQCASAPCRNGGRCLSTPEGHVCQCPPDYEGINCERKYNACQHMQCLNQGECVIDKRDGVTPYCK